MSVKHFRIQKIIDSINYDYPCVWDLCCDHGRIGIGLHHKLKHQKIYFVDRVPSIIKRLEHSDIPSHENLKFITKDILKLEVTDVQNELFILAGIGGYLIIDFLKKFPLKTSNDFLICAHQNIIQLRKFLSENQFHVYSEELIKEKDHFYELIFLKNDHKTSTPVTKVGSKLWDCISEDHLRYLDKQIHYLQNACEHQSNAYYEQVLKDYIEVRDSRYLV